MCAVVLPLQVGCLSFKRQRFLFHFHQPCCWQDWAELLSFRQWQWPASSLGTEDRPNWDVSGDGLYSGQSITQLSNTVPTAVYGDNDFVGVDFSATLSVNDNNFDDDYIGFIFGAANQSSLYVAQWKKRDQSPVSLDAEST